VARFFFRGTLTVMPEVDFLLVLPAYREQSRLPPYLRALTLTLAGAPFSTALLVVDDGSPVAEREALRALMVTGREGSCVVLPLLPLAVNQGKGGAILAGWRRGVVTARWLAFVDADGAVAAEEVRRVLELTHGAGERRCRWATRDAGGARRVRRVRRRFFRRWLGWLFRLTVSVLLGRGAGDSQCGFKIVPTEWFARVDGELRETGFCFDLELWLALRRAGADIEFTPVDWRDMPGGRLRVWRDGPLMLARVWRLRKRFAAR
jgi:dolichyl-phosphate beta-glucosyltransferase